MGATIADIVSDAQGIIGEVTGPGVQHYGEDRVFDDVVRGFNMLFTKRVWEQYHQWFQLTLDGTLGIITTDSLEQVRSFEDFIDVYRDGEETPLPIMPKSRNPYIFSSGMTRLQYWTILPTTSACYTKRKLQFYPKTSTGLVNVSAKVYPLIPPATGFDWTDTLELDRDLLAMAGAYMTLVGDDLNAGAAETVKGFMDMRYNDITAALSSHRIPLGRRSGVPNEWYVRTP